MFGRGCSGMMRSCWCLRRAWRHLLRRLTLCCAITRRMGSEIAHGGRRMRSAFGLGGAFDRECARRGWVSRARLESPCSRRRERIRPLPAKVVMLGFDRITPARKRLIACDWRRGGEGRAFRGSIGCDQRQDWCGRRPARRNHDLCALDSRLLDENPLFESRPPARIGVIVPDAQAVRSDIERIFRRVLMPETDDVLAPAARMPFEFSLGQPLGDAPVIRAALLLLRWAVEPAERRRSIVAFAVGVSLTEHRAQSAEHRGVSRAGEFRCGVAEFRFAVA